MTLDKIAERVIKVRDGEKVTFKVDSCNDKDLASFGENAARVALERGDAQEWAMLTVFSFIGFLSLDDSISKANAAVNLRRLHDSRFDGIVCRKRGFKNWLPGFMASYIKHITKSKGK